MPRCKKYSSGSVLVALVLIVLVAFPIQIVASTSMNTVTSTITTPTEDPEEKKIQIVFSDLDGTLLHYPKKLPRDEKGNKLLRLPPSSTGLRGIVSSKTLSLVEKIRQRDGKFVLVSGMRTSTFLRRLPYLPKADAYCVEAGGRIFLPVALDDNDESGDSDSVFKVKPEPYDGCSPEALQPFGIVEDFEWRRRMNQSCGEENLTLQELKTNPDCLPPLNERDGLLWDFARHLGSLGFVVDSKGYSTCFRANKKQQPRSLSKEQFESLSDGSLDLWEGLATSVNLSCVDFYPATSGKKNCCLYLVDKFLTAPKEETTAEEMLKKHAVCLCDDDNDVEMAKACHHAFIPGVTSETLRATIDADSNHFTVTGGEGTGAEGTQASEAALEEVLKYFAPDIEAEQ